MKKIIFILLSTVCLNSALADYSDDEVTSEQPLYNSSSADDALSLAKSAPVDPPTRTALTFDMYYNGGYLNTGRMEPAAMNEFMQRLGGYMNAGGEPGVFRGGGWTFKIIQPAGR